jgi:ribosomal protein L17
MRKRVNVSGPHLTARDLKTHGQIKTTTPKDLAEKDIVQYYVDSITDTDIDNREEVLNQAMEGLKEQIIASLPR